MAVRYLCPICEHELKGLRKYCKECHSFVKEPLIFTGIHLPNESECYRADVDYMDPRNLKKQQDHMNEHKKHLPDRPQSMLDQRGFRGVTKEDLRKGREWMEEQRRALQQSRGTSTKQTYTQTKSMTYADKKSSPSEGPSQGVAQVVPAIFFIIFSIMMMNC